MAMSPATMTFLWLPCLLWQLVACSASSRAIPTRLLWSLKPSLERFNYYQHWADSEAPLYVGDSLVFWHESETAMDVRVVGKATFRRCSTGGPGLTARESDEEALERDKNGDSVMVFRQPGRYYFVSGEATLCALGMKFCVHVRAAAAHPRSRKLLQFAPESDPQFDPPPPEDPQFDPPPPEDPQFDPPPPEDPQSDPPPPPPRSGQIPAPPPPRSGQIPAPPPPRSGQTRAPPQSAPSPPIENETDDGESEGLSVAAKGGISAGAGFVGVALSVVSYLYWGSIWPIFGNCFKIKPKFKTCISINCCAGQGKGHGGKGEHNAKPTAQNDHGGKSQHSNGHAVGGNSKSHEHSAKPTAHHDHDHALPHHSPPHTGTSPFIARQHGSQH